MGATLEGTFKIIDKASPAMRKMELQAIATDAAVEKLGHDLDMLGTKKQLASMGSAKQGLAGLESQGSKTEKQMTGLGTETKKAGVEMDKMGSHADKTSNKLLNLEKRAKASISTWATFRKGIKDVGSELLKFGMTGLKLGGVVSVIGLAAQGIGALAGGLISLVPRFTQAFGIWRAGLPVLTALGSAALVAKSAIGGLTQAIQGNGTAFAQLGTSGQQLTRFYFQTMQQRWAMHRQINQAFFQSVTPAVEGAFNRAGGPLTNALSGVSSTLGSTLSAGLGRATSPQALREFSQMSGTSSVLIKRLGDALFNMAGAFARISVAAAPVTKFLALQVDLWTKHFEATEKSKAATGAITDRLWKAEHALAGLWRTGKDMLHVIETLFHAAAPSGNSLWTAWDRAMERWVKFRGSGAGAVQLRQEIQATIKPFEMMGHIIAGIGGGLLSMGGGTGLVNSLQRLSTMGPGLQRLLNAFANNLGPALVSSVGNIVRLFSDLGTGPLPIGVAGIGKIAGFVDDIVRHSGPFKSLFVTVFSTALISRYLVKLGLLQKGWLGVAMGAREAAVAEDAASMGGGGGILGPVGMAGKGLFGRIGGLFRRGGRAGALEETGTMADLGTGAAFGGAAAAAEGGGLLAGLGGMAGKFGAAALGVGSKVFLPLMAMQGLLGAFGAARSGNWANQVGQSAWGATNAMTFGLAGHIPGIGGYLTNRFMTPDQRVAGAVAANQGLLNKQLANVSGTGLAKLNGEVNILQDHIRAFSGSQQTVAQQYLQQLRSELAARKQLVQQMRAEQHARQIHGAAGFNAMLHREAPGVFRRYGVLGGAHRLDSSGLAYAFGMTNAGARHTEEHALAANIYAEAQRDPALAAELARVTGAITRHEGGRVRFSTAGGLRMFTGTHGERAGLMSQLRSARAANIGGNQSQRIRNLITQLRTQHRAELAALAASVASAVPVAAFKTIMAQEKADMKRVGHAGGGRIGGRGLHDTVAVPGGMAAPGELIVNRHTEARVNSMLNPFGVTLGGMVGREAMPHWASGFARGGRLGGVDPKVRADALAVMNRFPGLSVTSTYRPGDGYHGIHEAVDLAAPMNASGMGMMNTAASWVRAHLGAGLLEGIHNPGLSIKNGKTVPSSFWGSATWAQHLNHIHLAAGNKVIGANPGGMFSNLAAGIAKGARSAGKAVHSAFSPKSRGASINLGLGSALDPGNMSGLGGISVANWGDTTGAGSMGGKSGRGAAAAANVGGTGGTPDANRKIGKALMGILWPGSEWPNLDYLWTRESGWNQFAKNPHSGAYGIPQSLPATKMASAGKDWKTNPRTQIAWGLNYIRGRYGSPSGAAAHERSQGWYSGGGRIPFKGWFGRGGTFTATGPTMIGVGERGRPETVTVGKAGGGGSTFSVQVFVQGDAVDGVEHKIAREVDKVFHKFARILDHQAVGGSDLAVT